MGASSIRGAINFLVTIINMRARHEADRAAMFVWTAVVLIYGAVRHPSLSVAITMLLADRHFGTHFFLPAQA